MSNSYEIKFLGWYHDGKSDKVLGMIVLPYDTYIYWFWGRRGKTYTFKRYEKSEGWVLDDLKQKKLKKGYRSVAIPEMEQLLPGFLEELTDQLALKKLFSSFHGEVDE